MIDLGTPPEMSQAEDRSSAVERRDPIADPPRILTIETTSVCNLRCLMCSQAIGTVNRPKHLQEDIAARLVGYLGTASDIQLHGIGEPVLSPAFWSLLEALPPGRNSSINTNLTHLTESQARQLGTSNLGLINVSLDAATAATFRFIRGYDLDIVLSNFRRLLSYRRPGMSLAFNMTIMRSNHTEIPALVELAAREGADCVFLWHLNRWDDDLLDQFELDREGRHFSYRREGMWEELGAVREQIVLAKEIADRLGVSLHLDHNKDI